MRESALTLVPVPGDVIPEILSAFTALSDDGECDEPRVAHDGDGFTCEHCNVAWDSDGTRARFTDDYGQDLAERAACSDARLAGGE